MPEPLLLGLDLGTSALKCGVWDVEGRRFGATRVCYPTRRRKAAAEQHAGDWWNALVEGVHTALAEVDRGRIAAIGIGGHAPSPVFVDAELVPVAPVLTWIDRRANSQCERILEALERPPEGGPERLAVEVSARATWLRDHEPGRFARMASILHSGDYLIARLTGRRITISSREPAVFSAAGLSPSLFPEVEAEPGGRVGGVATDAAGTLGIAAGVPVVAGGLDSFLGSVGSGICEPGDACINGGSSSVVALLARPPAVGRFELAGHQLLSRPIRTSGRAEAVVRAQRRTLEELAARHGPVRRLRSVGGRAADPQLNQLTAKILDRPVEIPRETDSGALGAAMLAAIALGLVADHSEAARRMVHLARVVRPPGRHRAWTRSIISYMAPG